MAPRSQRHVRSLPSQLRIAFPLLCCAYFTTSGSSALLEMPSSLADADSRTRLEALQVLHKRFDDGMAPPNASFEISIRFENIQGINLKTSTITFLGWYRLIWKDEGLAWNDTQWQLRHAFRSADEIWTPDIQIFNALDWKNSFTDMRARVSPDGSVFWSRPFKASVFCSFKGLENFPKDELSCSIELGSWFLDGLQQNILPWSVDGGLEWTGSDDDAAAPAAFQDYTFKNIEVERYEKFYSCCPEPWYMLKYHISFTRATNFYISRLVLPQIAIAVISWLTFWMHPEVGERLGFGIALILTSVAFDWTASEHTPICDEPLMLTVLTQSTFCMIIFSLLESTVVLYIFWWRAWTLEHFVPGPVYTLVSYCRRKHKHKEDAKAQTILSKKMKLLGTVPDTEFFVSWLSGHHSDGSGHESTRDDQAKSGEPRSASKGASTTNGVIVDKGMLGGNSLEKSVRFLERSARIALYRKAFYLLDSNYTAKLEYNEVHHFGEYMMGQDWTSEQCGLFMEGKNKLSFSDFCDRCDQLLYLGQSKQLEKLEVLVDAFTQSLLRAEETESSVSKAIAHNIDFYCRWIVPPVDVIIMTIILYYDFTPSASA